MKREHEIAKRLYKLSLGVCIFFILSAFMKSSQIMQNSIVPQHNNRNLQPKDVLRDYGVSWDIDLGGKEHLLESDFLRAGLEYSAKVFINRELDCEEDDNGDLEITSFFGVRIDNDDGPNKRKKIRGTGKCKGNRTRCKKKVKKSISDAGKGSVGSCGTSIFDLFKDALITASFFNYNVTLDVINDFAGNLDIDLSVEFTDSQGDGLDQIDFVSFDVEDPVEIIVSCDGRCEQQRQEQRSTMMSIFGHFEIPFDGSKHECLFEGINCNDEDLVTHIWLSKNGDYDLSGKSIPTSFFSLPFLQGLFLGGNRLIGRLPIDIGTSNSDLKMLWLQDNDLTGPIPTRIGNLPLRELNIHGNKLTGPLPVELGKLSKLRLLNLGKNELTGTIPLDFFNTSVRSLGAINPSCRGFRNAVEKLRLAWLSEVYSASSTQFLSSIQILSLHENRLTGSIPVRINSLNQLVELSLGGNEFAGDLPTQIGLMKQLQVLDVHNNMFSGLIPDEIGDLHNLKVLNLYNNQLEKTIPASIGLLTQLQELVLDKNRLTGPIPTEVGKLTKPDYISFSGNEMEGEIPTEIGNLRSLKNLDIRDYSVVSNNGNKISAGTLPTELGNLRQWKYVVLRGNGLEGTVPTELGSLVGAEAISMKDQKVTGPLPTNMGNLRSLSHLYLKNNSLDGTIPASIGIVKNLKTFDIAMNKFTGQVPLEIVDPADLSHINIGKNRLNGDVFASFRQMSANRRQASKLVYLNVESNLFTGTVPKEIGDLTKLKSLDAGSNKFDGTLPAEFGNLGDLENLNLGSNRLNGNVPLEMGNLKKLKSFVVAANNLGGVLPSEIGDLDELENLNLGSNFFSGDVPPELGKLKKLRELSIAANKLEGSLPSEIGNLAELKSLDLEDNSLSGEVPPDFGRMKTLTRIKLGNNRLDGTIPVELSEIVPLKEIGLSRNMIIGSIPTQFARAQALEQIDFRENFLDGSIPPELGQILSLKEIKLANNAFEGFIPTEFGLNKNLNLIEIRNNLLSGVIPTELGDLDFLESMDLEENQIIGTIPSELAKIFSLVSMDFSNNLLTGVVPNELGRLENLKVLDISGNNVTAQRFMCGLQNLDLELSITLNCNDYCGTEDEECNSLSVGDAKCLDVGCTFGGRPQCTSSCRLDYSSCIANSDEISFQLDLETVDRGYETSWEIRDGEGPVWQVEGIYRNFDPFIVEYRCLKRECYEFELYDEGQDGLCCGQNSSDFGTYSLILDGNIIDSTDPNITSSVIYKFGDCAVAPSSSPSIFPSIIPTSIPSVNPTQDIEPDYNITSWNSQCRPLTFRVSDTTWVGKWSDSLEIGVSGGGFVKSHDELTSRSLHDEETFVVLGSKNQVGVGLCIDRCGIESTFAIRDNYFCVGFHGDKTVMFASDETNTEYTFPVDRPVSQLQGFTYDKKNNCVSHIGSLSEACTPLPVHFRDKAVRAIAEVWNSATGTITNSDDLTNRDVLRQRPPLYNETTWNSHCIELSFRSANSGWNGRWSTSTQIGIFDKGNDRVHIELTSRRLNDGEGFNILGSSEYIGVGLCIDSCDLESILDLRGEHNCVGFFGNDVLLWSADENDIETSVVQVNSPSNIQGFIYDQSSNCITHIDSINGTCAPLPDHFDGKSVRAVAQVWNNSFADLFNYTESIGISNKNKKI